MRHPQGSDGRRRAGLGVLVAIAARRVLPESEGLDRGQAAATNSGVRVVEVPGFLPGSDSTSVSLADTLRRAASRSSAAASTGRPSSSCRLDKLSSRARNDAMRAPAHNGHQGKAHGDSIRR